MDPVCTEVFVCMYDRISGLQGICFLRETDKTNACDSIKFDVSKCFWKF